MSQFTNIWRQIDRQTYRKTRRQIGRQIISQTNKRNSRIRINIEMDSVLKLEKRLGLIRIFNKFHKVYKIRFKR